MVIAFALGDESKPIDTFLILQYMRGEMLQTWKLKDISVAQKQAFYESLADIYLDATSASEASQTDPYTLVLHTIQGAYSRFTSNACHHI